MDPDPIDTISIHIKMFKALRYQFLKLKVKNVIDSDNIDTISKYIKYLEA